MKRDIHNQEQIYICLGWPKTGDRPERPCGVVHQESTVAVREAIVDGRVERTMYCDSCGSDRLRLFTDDDAVEQFQDRVAKRVQGWLDEQT